MQVLRDTVDVEAFFAGLPRAATRLLMLDYDGTLAPLRPERDQAFPYPGVREGLSSLLQAGHTRIVIISGRWSRDLIGLLGVDPLPEIWGSHGWERRLPDGTYRGQELHPAAREGLSRARRWAAGQGLARRLEPKPGCLALHVRDLPAADGSQLQARVCRHWEPLAQDAGLVLHAFDGGIELRASGRDKGWAVRQLLAEAGRVAAAAYLGDDQTDEDAFSALGDAGLAVLVRPSLRPTAAHVWIRPPEALMAFFDRWQRACAMDGAGGSEGRG